MAFLVKVVTGGSAQVPMFSMYWLIAATIISSRGLGCVDHSGRVGALRSRAAGAAIATIFIAPILLVVPVRSFGLARLGAMRRHDLCLVRAKKKGALVPSMILNSFQGRAVALGAASIHFTDPQRKVQGGLGISRDSLFDGLVLGVLSTTFLFGLGADEGP